MLSFAAGLVTSFFEYAKDVIDEYQKQRALEKALGEFVPESQMSPEDPRRTDYVPGLHQPRCMYCGCRREFPWQTECNGCGAPEPYKTR